MINRLNFIVAFILAIIISRVIGRLSIKKLKELKYGQSIREEGPQAHFVKQGTPTMGGVIFLGTLITITLINFNFSFEVLLVSLGVYGLGLLGFIDDYMIIKYKSNEGISPKQKLLGQLLIGIVISVMAYQVLGSEIYIPLWNIYIDFGILYIPFNVLFIMALSNSVNLTDGLDGLSTSVTIIVLAFFVVPSIIQGKSGLSIQISTLIGGLIGFLYFNWHPAKVFMGDVGSLALGGFVASVAIVLKLQLIVPIVGVIYFLETLSVIIQVVYFKKTGKRVFLMTPIHHHFELSGDDEITIVKKFSSVTLIGAILSLIMIFN